MPDRRTDVIVVGSGPNGLAAAVTCARAGLSVTVYEAAAQIGGGVRSFELTEPGFWHDWAAAVHAMAFASPFFRRFGITDRVQFVVPDASYAHPLDDGRAGIAWRDLDRTVHDLGADGPAWQRMFSPLVENADRLVGLVTSSEAPVAQHPATAVRYGLRAFEQGSPIGPLRFASFVAPAMLAGVFAHSIGRVPSVVTGSSGLLLATLAHAGGWPIPVGGSQAVTDAMARDLEAHGGRIETNSLVTTLAELPPARAVLFDTSPRALLEIAGEQLTPAYARALQRYRYGNAASKVDFALCEPVPWTNPDLRHAGTVHLGGRRTRVANAEAEVAVGDYPESPFVMVNQPSLFDATRAPRGMHTLWSYTHVPHGSARDMTETITRQIERYAPGFRDVVLASRATPALSIERGDPNFVGGDIGSGAVDLKRMLARPALAHRPWRAGAGLYLCSAATPPGPGVHGMGGFHAASLALDEVFGLPVPSLRPQSTPADEYR